MKIINNFLLQLISLLIFTNAIANENRFDEIVTKLDTIEANQDTFIEKKIHSPLNNRKNGVELNLARLLMINDEFTTFSGSYSRFDHDKGVEWAFPVYWGSEKNDTEKQTNVATLDAHYRKFLGDSIKGFYISGFSRMTFISGPTGNDFNFSNNRDQSKQSSEKKFGVGIGIGYRIFSGNNYYWGTSLSIGRNVIGDNNKFVDALIDDSEYIFDVELLKFGYSF